MSGSWNTDWMPHRRSEHGIMAGVTDEAVLHNELEQLADIARHEIDASRGSVAAGFSPEAKEAAAAITARLVKAGVDPLIAEQATTAWIALRDRPVLECLEKARSE